MSRPYFDSAAQLASSCRICTCGWFDYRTYSDIVEATRRSIDHMANPGER